MSDFADSQERWTAVEDYLVAALGASDPVLDAALAACHEAGLPPISVSPNQGKFLMLMARAIGARSILEVGTLGGSSTIWLARGLAPGGRVTTLEIDAKHAEVAEANFVRAGMAEAIELRRGPALDVLPRLAAEGRGPFDLVFIDADKPRNPDYFMWALRLSRPGSMIVVDNVVREGAVIDADGDDASVHGVRRLNELLAAEPRVDATALQTVGSKGYDGFAIAVVR